MKKRHLLLLVTCLFTSCLFACSSGTEPADDNNTVATTTKGEVTTKEPTTTAEPTTTVPPTTEEPTTPEETTTKKVSVNDYEFKGRRYTVDMSLKEYFDGFIIEDGTVIKVNDIFGEEFDDNHRAKYASGIVTAIWMEYNREKVGEFEDMYWEPGSDVFEISLDENVVIEYNEGHKWYFEYIGENKSGFAVFDIYEID